jgi:hypothetical protein
MQARLIASAPHLLKLVKDLRDYARNNSELDDDLIALAKRADQLRQHVETDTTDVPKTRQPG